MSKETQFQKGLAAFMKRKDLNQNSLAMALGIPRMTVNYWVHGKSEPILKYIKKLLVAGMTPKELFG